MLTSVDGTQAAARRSSEALIPPCHKRQRAHGLSLPAGSGPRRRAPDYRASRYAPWPEWVFPEMKARTNLNLAEARSLSSGALALRYECNRKNFVAVN
jgi:hypothetical protein